MISQFGSLLLMVGLAVAVYGIAAAAIGARLGRWELVASAYRAVLWLFGLVTVAALLLVTALITYDFSIAYVARNTLRGTPLYYRVTALWGSLEGSLLLWQWLISLFSAGIIWSSAPAITSVGCSIEASRSSGSWERTAAVCPR